MTEFETKTKKKLWIRASLVESVEEQAEGCEIVMQSGYIHSVIESVKVVKSKIERDMRWS